MTHIKMSKMNKRIDSHQQQQHCNIFGNNVQTSPVLIIAMAIGVVVVGLIYSLSVAKTETLSATLSHSSMTMKQHNYIPSGSAVSINELW